MKPNFSRRDRGGVVRIDPPPVPTLHKNTDKSKRSGGILKEAKPRPGGISTRMDRDRDVEKGFGPHAGFGTQTKVESVQRPPPPSSRPTGAASKSSFEMDEPLRGNRGGAGKKRSGGWMKMLGRK